MEAAVTAKGRGFTQGVAGLAVPSQSVITVDVLDNRAEPRAAAGRGADAA